MLMLMLMLGMMMSGSPTAMNVKWVGEPDYTATHSKAQLKCMGLNGLDPTYKYKDITKLRYPPFKEHVQIVKQQP